MAAHCVVVEGLELSAKLAGHPVLDFCNTLTGWDGEAPWDYLQSYDHLAVWAGFDELLPAERIAALRHEARRRGGDADAALERARGFRARLYDVLCNGPSAQAFGRLAEDVEAAVARLRLRQAGDTIGWEIASTAGLAAPIDAVAWSAGELLASSELSLVRSCPGHGCGWLFLDRRGRRRWCTMTTCGNRAKVKRFATRHRVGAEHGGGPHGAQP